jgi:ComF family protein
LHFVRSCANNCVDFVYPPFCVVCNAALKPPGVWLCPACTNALQKNAADRQACERCAMDRRITTCACALAWDHPFERIHALFSYDDAVQKIIHAIKYQGRKSLGYHIGRTFASGVPDSFREDASLMVPIPLHFLRRMHRGYNQAEHFARGINAGFAPQITMHTDVIRRRRFTRTQTRLTSQQRSRNLSGAFAVNPAASNIVKNKTIILVDDVVTTAATAAACTEVLLKAGARTVRLLTLARA